MKKIFLVMIAATAFSQATQAQLFYAQGGVNLANITNSASGNTEDNAILTTFNAGLMGRFGLSETVDLESGLLLTGRGSKAETTFNNGNDYVKAKFNPLYVELPVNVVVNIPLSAQTKLFVNAGPYAAVGIGGKTTTESKFGIIKATSESDIKFSNDNPFTSAQEDAGYNKLKRFDYGLNFGAGLDLKSVILKANYGLGFTKINSTDTNNNADDKNKYRTLSISVGIPLSR